MEKTKVSSGEYKKHNPEVLKEFENAEWEEIHPRLLKYAAAKAPFYLRGTVDFDPEDLVNEAVTLAYSTRRWNKELYPTLLDFLKSIVRSIINHKFEHFHKFKKMSIPLGDKSFTESELEELSQQTPEKILGYKNELQKLKEAIYDAVKDDEEVGLVAICIIEDRKTKPKEIAEDTGYEIKQVNNILKRLRRKVKNITL